MGRKIDPVPGKREGWAGRWRARERPSTLKLDVALRLWLALVVAAPCSLPAQGDSARVAGTARSALNGQPLARVMVAVRGTRLFSVTDSTGAFTLAGLPSGRQTLRILYGDSLSYDHAVTLERGKTLRLAVLLDVAAVELAPVVVEASSVAALRSLVGFYDRKRFGFGRYYTPEQIERRRGMDLRTLLVEAGVQVQCRLGACVPIVREGGRACVPTLYLDGWAALTDDVNLFRAEDLAAVEIYRRAAEVPLEFGEAFASACGVIVLWSRR